MAADLYKMQDDQRFPEIRIDKPEFVSIPYKSFPCFIWNSFSFYYNSRIAGISSPGLSLKY